MTRFIIGLLLVWLFAALIVHFGLARAGTPDACEIACGRRSRSGRRRQWAEENDADR